MTKQILKKYEDFLEERLVSLNKKPVLAVILLFGFALLTRLLLTNYSIFLRNDAYTYLIKSIEIANGNLIPMRTHSMGLPFLTAPFFLIFKYNNIFDYMVIAKFISNMIGASIIFPLYFILTKIVPQFKTKLTILILFVFSSALIINSTRYLTESLFIFCLLFALYFTMDPKKEKQIIYALIFTAFAWLVRPTGILVIVIVLLSFRVNLKINNLLLTKERFRYLLLGLLLFGIIISPFMIQRYILFGSPFDYGANNNFLDRSLSEAWSENVPHESLLSYLEAHSVFDYIDKFLIKGLFTILFYLVHGDGALYEYSQIISPLLLFFFFIGFLMYGFKKEFFPLTISFFLFIIGSSFFWSALGVERHLLILIPLVLIFSGIGIFEVTRTFTFPNILLLLFLIIYSIFSLISPVGHYAFTGTAEMPLWTNFVVTNITNAKIVIGADWDLLMMNYPKASVAGVSQDQMYDITSNISLISPGYFLNLTSAINYYAKIGVTHLILEEKWIRWSPHLQEFSVRTPNCFKQIYPTNNFTIAKDLNIFLMTC